MKQNPAKRTTKISKKAVKKTPVTPPANAQQTVGAKLFPVVIVTDQNLIIKNWNKEAEALFGWSSKEAIGKHPDKLFQTVYPSSTTAAVLKKIKQAGSFSGAAAQKNKNKQSIKVQLAITAFYNKGGKLTGTVYIINLKTRAEKVKKQATEIKKEITTPVLNNVFERVTDAFIAFDNDWRYRFVNKKATELLGKSKKQLIGKNVWEVFPDGVDQPFYKALHKAKKTQKPSHLELYYPPFDRWYEDHIYPSENGISVYYQDITEKKIATLKLKESEEKYRSLIEQASEAVIIYSLDGTIYDFNKAAYEQTGYSKKEFQKLRLPDLLNNEDIILNPGIVESFKTGKAVLFERKLKLKNGTLVDVELNTRMLPDGKLLGFARNITERNKALTALKDSEIRFRSLFEHASDGIYIADPEGKYVEVNESGCKLVGYTKEEISKLSLFDLVVKEENAIPLRIDEIKAGKHVIQQRLLRKKDGENVPVEISSKLLPDGRMLGMVRDITERIEIKNKIKKEKELSEKIINSLPGIFYLSDQTPNLIIWNKMFETISGYSAEELKSIRPIHLFATEDQPAVFQSLQKTYTEGAADVEVRLLTKSGEQIPFYFTGVRIEYNGKLCMLGTGINLTERKKAEEKLLNTEKRYRALIENSTDGLTVVNENGTVVEMSPSGKKIVGYDANEIIGNTRPDLILPDDQELHFSAFAEIKKDPSKVKQFEYRHKMPDGSYKWLECSYHNLLNEPAIGAIVLNYRDISERKTAADQILREKFLSDSIINSLPGIFYMYDEAGKFLKWNKNFELVTGYKKEEISNMQPVDFYDHDQKENIRNRIKTVFKNKMAAGIEIELQTKKKQKIPFFINSMIIDYEGRPCLIGLGLDLSDRKKAEEEIKKSYERFELIGKATHDGLWD
jgi:PAS domain S-box-containing protein